MEAETDESWDFLTHIPLASMHHLVDKNSGWLEARLSLFHKNELFHIKREKLVKFVGFTVA